MNWNEVKYWSQSGRIELAVASTQTNFLYASVSKLADGTSLGFYLSEDNGNIYTLKSNQNLMGHYNYPSCNQGTTGFGGATNSLIVSNTNSDVLYIGGVNTFKSINRGITWTMINRFHPDICTSTSIPVVHADKHGFVWQGSTLWEVNDGGIYKSNDNGLTWINKSDGIDIGCIYKIGVSESNNKIITGHADNGTKLKTGPLIWQEILDSDGGECIIHPNNTSTLYAETYNGKIRRSYNNGLNWDDIYINIPNPGTGYFVTPFSIDPDNPNKLYIGYSKLYKSLDEGDSWTEIGDFGSNDLRIIAVAPSNPNFIYVSNGNQLWRSELNGNPWIPCTVPGNRISDIDINSNNPLEIFLTRQTYLGNSQIYKSNDGGQSWINYSQGIPAIPANTIVFQNDSNGLLYVGLDIGIYYRDNTMSEWQPYGMGLPTVEITELEISYYNSKLYAGTFGRGLWSAPIFYCYNAPDLIIDNQNVSSPVVQQGGTLNLSFHVENIGNVATNPHVVSFHLSSDGVLDPMSGNEIYVDEYEVLNPILAQTFHDVVDFPLVIPPSTPPGEYFLFFSADGGLTVTECLEDNNQATKLIVVQENTNTSQAYYRHWFDNNLGAVQTFNTTSTNNIFTIDKLLSTNTLSEGLHTLNFQLKDDLWSSITSSFFYKLNNLYPAGNPQYQYWYDNNYSNNYVQSITSTNNLIVLSNLGTSSIQDGLHTFNIRFKPDFKHWTAVNSSFFYKPRNLPIGIYRYEYWLDQNYSDKVSVNNSSTPDFILLSNLDMNDVSTGLHTFNIRFRPQGKAWSSVNSSFFYKTTLDNAGQPFYQYWFDNNVTDSVTVNIAHTNNLILNNEFNTDNLPDGLHTFNIRFRSDGRKYSSVNSSFFYKVPAAILDQPKYQYWFDNDIQDSVTINTTSTIDFLLLDNMNAMSLSEGLHTFNIRFKPTGGLWSAVNTSFFVRGKSTIATEINKCLYWYNDDFQNHNTIMYSGSSNVFDIIYANTPNLTNGEHTISMFFMDNAGYWSSIVKDTFVKDTILPILCPNNQIFTSGLGNAYNTLYQWQVDDGAGYINLSNSNTYSGVNTDSLIITNAPPLWYGTKYRCIVTLPNGNTINGIEYTLKFVYIWTGTANNDWKNPLNWNCQEVPGINADVYINTGNVNINSNVDIGSLTTGQGANLELHNNQNLNIQRYYD